MKDAQAAADAVVGSAPTLARRVAALVGLAVLAGGFSVLAVKAGFWQMGRHEVRAAAMAAYEANATLAPVALEEAVADGSLANDEWRTVTATGVFDGDSATLLRNRPVDRTAVYQVLMWFDTGDGRSLLINTGYLPVPDDGSDPVLPAVPDGTVDVTVIARSFDADDGRRDEGATRIVLAQVPPPHGTPVDGYGVLRDVCAGGDCQGALATPVPLPTLSLGPHFAYAWQWWAFAVLAPVGAVLLGIREWRRGGEPADGGGGDGDGDDAHGGAHGPADEGPQPRGGTRRRVRPLSDEQVEDAL